MTRPTAFSEDLARRLKRMLRQWDAFRITGPGVAFHKGPDSASCHVEPSPAGGGSRLAMARVTASGATPGYYQLIEVDGESNDLASGRVWDGQSGNEPEAREFLETVGVPNDAIVMLRRTIAANGDTLWVFADPDPALAHARITAEAATAGRYRLIEIDAAGGDLANGRVWDGQPGNEPEARELNGTEGIEADSRVLLTRAADASGNRAWTFQDPTGGALPDGGSQYQVLQRDAAGNAIWDFPRAHP
ncbi:MAG: hypothetical protein AAGI54_00680 [Planctomycetota bacterium]